MSVQHRNTDKLLVLVHKPETGRVLHDDAVLSVERGEFGLEVSLHRDAGAFAEDSSACWDDLTEDQAVSQLLALRDMIDDAVAWVRKGPSAVE